MNYKKTKTHEYIRNFLIINNYLYQNDYVSKKLTCENIIEQKKYGNILLKRNKFILHHTKKICL